MPNSTLSDYDDLNLMDDSPIPPTPEKSTNFKIPKRSTDGSTSSPPKPAQRPVKSPASGPKHKSSKPTKPRKPGVPKTKPEKIFLSEGLFGPI